MLFSVVVFTCCSCCVCIPTGMGSCCLEPEQFLKVLRCIKLIRILLSQRNNSLVILEDFVCNVTQRIVDLYSLCWFDKGIMGEVCCHMIKWQKIVWDHFQIWKCFTVSKSENASTAVFKSTNTSKVFFSNQKMLQLQTPPPIWGTVPWPPHGAIPVPWTPKGLFSLTPTRGSACFPWPPQGAVPVSCDPHKGQHLFPWPPQGATPVSLTPTRGNTCPGKGSQQDPLTFFLYFQFWQLCSLYQFCFGFA